MKPFSAAHLILAITFTGAVAHADVKLPAVISDHMVLQAGPSAAIWGWADAGEPISVSLGEQTVATKTDADGKWSVKLENLRSSDKAQALTVKGKNTLTVNDVLVGEVWLASGQSNMEMQIK